MIPDHVQPTVIILAIIVNFTVALVLSAAYFVRPSRWLGERTVGGWFLLLIAGSTAFLFWHRTNLYPLGPEASEVVRLLLVLACAAIPSYWLVTFVRGRGE